LQEHVIMSAVKSRPAPPSMLARLFGRRGDRGYSRRHERNRCFIPGSMQVEDIEASFDGAILELSAGGCSFRPASMFLLNREGETVIIHTPAMPVRGIIRSTRPSSYGVQFMEEISIDAVERSLAYNLS